MTEFNGNEISKETLYSGTITLTGGTVYNGVMKFSATVSKNIVYSGFITLYPPRSVCGQISWKAKLLSSSTCNYFGEPSSCKAASCSWTATSISGNTGLVVYDELYSNTVAALLNNKPTRDGYEFL
ncbi:MAG: hypothetical protein LBU27_01140 [Candidatus Peribacteria bacterium]|jgi:hypothetical protein|nr:hypothetical protein [Candidatus Peribacteria bacterium]